MGFRIVVRMTKFFTDERSFSYVFVNEKLKTIENLESYLTDMFDLKGPFCLMKDNILLPNCEDIQIIQADEMISVNPVMSSFSFINKTLPSPEEIVEKDVKKKKRKKNKELSQEVPVADFDVEKSPNKENISLDCTSESTIMSKIMDSTEVFTAIKNIEEYHSELVKMSEEDEVEAMKSKALNALKDFFPTNINGVSDGRIKKRKRIRIRKSKKSNQVEYLQSDSESNITQNNKSLVLTNGKINSHVRFTPAVDKPITILQNEIVAQKYDKKPRIVRAIQPDMITTLNNSSDPTKDKVLNMVGYEKKDTEENIQQFYPTDCPRMSNNVSKEKTKNNEKNYQLSDVLKQLDNYPIQYKMSLKDNDIIIFKMLKIGDNYTPVVSEYILGKVSCCNAETQNIKLTIIDGQQECSLPSGKFHLEEDALDNSSDAPEYIDLAWDQLLEPRLIQS